MNKQELEHWVEILDNAFLDGDMYNARSIAMMLADEAYYAIERGQTNPPREVQFGDKDATLQP